MIIIYFTVTDNDVDDDDVTTTAITLYINDAMATLR